MSSTSMMTVCWPCKPSLPTTESLQTSTQRRRTQKITGKIYSVDDLDLEHIDDNIREKVRETLRRQEDM